MPSWRGAKISSTARAIENDLQTSGYHITTLENLGVGGSAAEFCRALYSKQEHLALDELIANRGGKSKRYWTDIYEAYGQHQTPIVDFILSDVVLDACGLYLGEIPVLNYVGLLLTPPQGGSIAEEWRASQDWHLDNDRPRRVKIFMLPLGVDEECGPTMFLPKAESRHQCYHKHYPGYFSDNQFAQAGLDPSKIIKFMGGPGAVLFIDTSTVFHCGSRTASKPRLTLSVDLAPVATYLPYKTALRASRPLPQINDLIFKKFAS